MSAKNTCNFFCAEPCREGYAEEPLTCRQRCGLGSTNTGLYCMAPCREGYVNRGGVCWFDKCPAGTKKSGVLCYEPCPNNHKEIGTSLCRERCRSGYSEVLGVCWKGLRSYVPKTVVRKSDGKQASYVPKSTTRHSYQRAIKMGLYPKILLGIIGALVVMNIVIKAKKVLK